MNIVVSTKSTTTPVGTPDISQLAMRMANGFMNNFDANQDGALSKDEFIKGMTTKGISADAATAQYYKIDTKGSGQITKQDLQSAIKNGAFAGGARSGRGGGGGTARVQAPAANDSDSDDAIADAASAAAVTAPDAAVANMQVVEPTAATNEHAAINAAAELEESGFGATATAPAHEQLVYTASPGGSSAPAQSAQHNVGNKLDQWV